MRGEQCNLEIFTGSKNGGTVKKKIPSLIRMVRRPLTSSEAGKLLIKKSSEITYLNVTEISSPAEVNLLLIRVIFILSFVQNLAF